MARLYRAATWTLGIIGMIVLSAAVVGINPLSFLVSRDYQPVQYEQELVQPVNDVKIYEAMCRENRRKMNLQLKPHHCKAVPQSAYHDGNRDWIVRERTRFV